MKLSFDEMVCRFGWYGLMILCEFCCNYVYDSEVLKFSGYWCVVV